MNGSGYRGFALFTFVLLAVAGSAHATIDMTGRWVVCFGSGTSVYQFTQLGTALTQPPSSAGQPGPRTGTIDPMTGVFTISDPVPCQTFGLFESCGIGATVAADGLSFSGGGDCAGGLG